MPGIRYKLNDAKKMRLLGGYVLNCIINKGMSFSVTPDQTNGAELLVPILAELEKRKYVRTDGRFGRRGSKYLPTPEGRKVVENYVHKLEEFKRVYLVFRYVDTGQGEFSYAKYFDLDDEGWNQLLAETRPHPQTGDIETRWYDLRLAVIDYKNQDPATEIYRENIDPVEMVFLGFVFDGLVGYEEGLGWQQDRLFGSVWDTVEEVLRTNWNWRDFGGKDVIQDIIRQGAALTKQLAEEETRRYAQRENAAQTEPASASRAATSPSATTTTTTVVEKYVEPVSIVLPLAYWSPFYDPFYVSPIWGIDYW